MLRDYQQTVYRKTVDAFRNGYKRPLVVLPCGGGKSYLFAEMAKNTRGEVLILTHRRELLSQHNDLLHNLGINARVSMVLTEANRLGQYQRPALIITDEAHLSRSQSWMRVLDYYNTYTVGFTATPVRLDGKPLGDMYDTLIEGVNVKWLIENHRLAPFEYYAPIAVETDGLRVQGGDYVIRDMEQLMSDRAIYSNVLKSWQRLAGADKTIAYCVSVKHAKETAQMFRDAGCKAVAIDGNTPAKQREEIMQQFRNGNIQILCNCSIISEGVSIDDVSCCLLLRPTESHALFWQQAMRSMRYQPRKVAKIIDCVGNYTRNPLPDADVTWSLTSRSKKQHRIDSDGNFFIRMCPSCFRVFKVAPKCPHCGHEYPLHPREIKAHEEIELQRITAEHAKIAEEQRKKMRQEVGKARTLPELLAIAKERGYSPAWAYKMMRVRGR